MHLPWLLLALGLVAHGNVVINEVLYHPASGNQDEEYIEVLNTGPGTVELSGWSLKGGIDFSFPAGTTMDAGTYLVIAKSLGPFSDVYPLPPSSVIGDFSRKLGNGGDTVLLLDADFQIIDSVIYDDRSPWPEAADGGGSSLELRHPALDNTLAQSWGASAPGGTPGFENSAYEANPSPVVSPISHAPAVPKSTQPVEIAFKASDDATIDRVTLHLTLSPVAKAEESKAFTSLQMFDDGGHADGEAGDDIYGATIPPQPAGSVVEFYATAQDDTGQVSTGPVSAPTENCLFQVDDSNQPTNLSLYRIIMTPADLQTLGTRDVFSNVLLNCTFISGNAVYYRKGIRYRGSTSRLIGDKKSYRIEFPQDDLFGGISEMNLNGNGVADQVVGWDVFEAFGMPVPLRELVNVTFNNEFLGPYLRIEGVDEPFLERNFQEEATGNLYRGVDFADFTYLGPDPDLYRDSYVKRTNQAEDDFSDIIDLANHFTNATEEEFAAGLLERIDVVQWLRYFAINSAVNNSEGGIQLHTGDDYYIYRRSGDNRFAIIPWDLDSAFLGWALDPIFLQTLPSIVRMIRHPQFVRHYYEGIEDALSGAMSPESIRTIVNRYQGAFTTNDLERIELVTGWRHSHLLEIIPQHLTCEIGRNPHEPTSGEFSYIVAESEITLSGEANAAHTISVTMNGQEAGWDPFSAIWETVVPLSHGTNDLLIEAIDENHEVAESIFLPLIRADTVQTMSGALWSDETWTAAGGPYHLTSHLIVPPTVTLRIEPGAIVLLDAGVGILVEGALDAEGATGFPIRFQPSGSAPWGGIGVRFSERETRLQHCEFLKASAAWIQGFEIPAAVTVAGSTAVLDGCVFRDCLRCVEVGSEGSLTYRNGVAENCGRGIGIIGAHGLVSDSAFMNTKGIYEDAIVCAWNTTGDSEIRDCRFQGGGG